MTQSLPVRADRDEERGAVGGAVGGVVSYLHGITQHSIAASHEVLLRKAVVLFISL